MRIIVQILLLCVGLSSVSAAIWRIRPKLDTTKCIRVTNSGTANGDGFSVETCDTSSTFTQFEGLPSPTSLSILFTGLSAGCRNEVLGGLPGTAPDGVATNLVKQVDYDPSNRAQYWIRTLPPSTYTQPSSGYFWFKNLADGKCMTTEWLSNYIDTYNCTDGAETQFWTRSPADSAAGGLYKFRTQTASFADTPCLQVTGANPAGGAATSMGACIAGAYNQGTAGIVEIAKNWRGVGSGKCTDGNVGLGGAAFQYDCAFDAFNHQWLGFNYPSDPSNLYIRSMNLNNGLCLTWDTTSTAANNVIMDTCDPGKKNQLWTGTA